MKFSFNWLRELTEGPTTGAAVIGPNEIARLISLHTAECEGVEAHGDDHVIEVDNKSLTHRPDLWGHYGMAREVAVILRHKLVDPVKAGGFPPHPSPIHVSIDDHALCPRYSALVFDDVKIQPSPQWMQSRLEALGLNPINNIVDVTNFVMAELAQPMHAFDAAKLRGTEIRVRCAQAGEPFPALNGETYTLDAADLVIADAESAVGLAGVIGGAGSAISESTTRIVLESANFNASSIRKTSSRQKLRTDASMRFEKAQDPANTVRGLLRAHELLHQICPGIRMVGGLADNFRPHPTPPPVLLPLDWLDRKLGLAVPAAEVRRILESLEFTVDEIDPRNFSVTVPSWRATKDVSIKEDLVEEVGRMVGYASVTPAAPLVPARVPLHNAERAFHTRVRRMAADQGFTEVMNYSFVSEEMARAFSLDPAAHVAVQNPIAADQNLLRSSLLPGIWKNILDNIRHFDQFRLFEIGNQIHPDQEVPHFAAALYAKDDDLVFHTGLVQRGAGGLLELKRLAECLAPGATLRLATATRHYEHPRRAADILLSEARVGRLFEFHPNMVEKGRAAVLDLDLSALLKIAPASARYQPLRRFPASAFDLSVVAAPRVLIGDVQSALERLAGPALLSIVFLREFTLPDGHRSLSYRLTVGAPDRTLALEEAGAVRNTIIEGMLEAGYQLRV